MPDKVTEQDLPEINRALHSGADVMIQNTGDGGYRIISSKPHVLKRSQPRQRKQHIPEYPKI